MLGWGRDGLGRSLTQGVDVGRELIAELFLLIFVVNLAVVELFLL